ncbi:gluconate 2-dehydrogenase subunit 3 family protein [Pararhodonellum marinum]|uniref:gluconate 2-dehydrogenase subunit 3 family protein n=1 Tax=Pararhodonellum marinum TaxID=2755358 RepID=UPI00188E7A06|nr:gluconate 2-dehydrogenase subunit 3 family protein [Pararhodonellum marinum]
MNRRENIKLLLAGSLGTGLLWTGCSPEQKELADTPVIGKGGKYNRTAEELEILERLKSQTFFLEEEKKKVEILVDIIMPADEVSGSATEAGVPDFIEFMMKDAPAYQTRMRGGLMWLDHESDERFGKNFVDLSEKERMAIIDDIAFPDTAKPELRNGVLFFNLMRDLTTCGFYTSEMGFKDLGYKGNQANVWNGVPDEVMQKHGFTLDQKYTALYLKPEERGKTAEWDEQGNLIG